jgi:type IV fimbrial biogenesis protein FimT
MKRNLGFTLIELMVALVVLVILISIAIPGFMNMIQSSRSGALANSIVIAFNMARSEAVKTNALVNLCPSSDGATCMVAPLDWAIGWIAQQNAGATLQVWDAPDTGAVIAQTGGATAIQFDGSGLMRQPAAAVTIISSYPSCTGQQARLIQISITGRVSVTRTACP